MFYYANNMQYFDGNVYGPCMDTFSFENSEIIQKYV